MVEREEQAVEEIPDEKRDDKDRRGNDPEVPSRLLAAQCFLRLFHIEEEVHVKVDAKKDHKHGNYALQVGGIASEAVILDTETSGSRGAENGTQGIKYRHLSHKQENKLQNRQEQIESIEDLCGGLHLRDQLCDRGARALCFHEVHMIAASGKRKQAEKEHENSHTADPVCKAPPEQDAVLKRFHGGKNTGTGRRKSGHSLKQGIHRICDGSA